MKTSEKIKNSTLTKKIGFIFILAILLQIPMFFINGIIRERNYSYINMVEEIGNEWGKKQTIAGPFLIVPYEDVESTIDYNSSQKEIKRKVERYYIVLPDRLNTKVVLNDEVRKRGIYKSTVYTGDINIVGQFPNLREILPANINPYSVYIGIGMSDTKSLMKVGEFKVNGDEIQLESGTGVSLDALRMGISGRINPDTWQEESVKFSINLSLRGNEGIEILPFGKENHFRVESPWKSPSFYGILPSEKTIDDTGFKAEWDISFFVRNYKQDFTDSSYPSINLHEGKVGVDLYEGVTHYRQVMRAVKYSILFIMLSLFVVYIFEVTSKRFTHYVQYGVVGFSLTLFYLVLLSMSEYFSFELAYLIATLMVTLPNALYIKGVTENKKYGVGMFLFLTGIYAILFSILKMEQYALITGTILIMLVLYVVMYLTRNMKEFLEE